MDFRFNVNNLLPKKINKITHTLIPEGFKGDRREYNECQRLLTRILDDIGEASAKAQGLNRTITSAVKLRDTDHIIYLMIDSGGNNGLGSVVGLLKTGSKTLFMFDENGLHYKLTPRCILDFYIHESRQRMGLGNELYQHMLAEENLTPIKLAIDRPSDKFLAFLMKHYGLSTIIPQNNKFVVFRGFFDDEIQDSENKPRYSNESPIRQAIEQKLQSINITEGQSLKNNSINGTLVARSAYGRYAASRPPCSMANIIHNATAFEQSAEQPRPSSGSIRSESRERPDSLNLHIDSELQDISAEKINSNKGDVSDNKSIVSEPIFVEELQNEASLESVEVPDCAAMTLSNNEISATSISVPNTSDGYLKTDKKSDNLSNETSPTCSQEVTAGIPQTSSGYLDLKFYHSPLW